ncbi:MAG: peptidoglycan endopeptidase [Mycobacterium sp.]
MFAIATASLIALVNQVSGTPYVTGGDSPHGTDCSGLASWVANAASGRPVYGNRFNTGNEEAALRARGFVYGTQPGALNIGWNGGHTAVTLPDGTPVSSGEGGGVRVGGGGAYQRQFTHHMYLPTAMEENAPADLPAGDPAPMAGPAPMDVPPPPPGPADLPAPDIAPPGAPIVMAAANIAPEPPAGPQPPAGPEAPAAPAPGMPA